MLRLLGIVLLVALAWLLLKRILGKPAFGKKPGPRTPPDETRRYKKTVRCARCGAYVPPAMTRDTPAGYICRDHE